MKKLLIVLSLLLVVSLLMAAFGCATEEPEEVVPEGPVPLPPEEAREEVSVDDSYAGEEVEVAVGGSLIVHLKSDPSTGFKWELVTITDETVLVEVDHKYVGPEAEAPEGPGSKEEPVAPPKPVPPKEEWWTFKVLKQGESIVRTAVDTFGKLDILVNNAGILRDKMVFNLTDEDWDIVIKVHLYGHFNTIKPACILFRQQRSGRIINTSSSAALYASTYGQVNYGAAKEGIVGLTRKVARDMGRYGVTCNCIRPSAATRLTLSDEMRKARPDVVARLEQQRPEDIAPLVVWLASDDAANVNGHTFHVETGRIALYSEPVMESQILKAGGWTIDELFGYMPTTVAAGLTNPDPPQPPKQ